MALKTEFQCSADEKKKRKSMSPTLAGEKAGVLNWPSSSLETTLLTGMRVKSISSQLPFKQEKRFGKMQPGYIISHDHC